HGRRAVQHAGRPARGLARAVPPAPLARPRDRRARARDDPGARASRADHAESHRRGGLRGLGAGARSLFPRSVGRALHRDPRLRRRRRDAAQGRPADGAARPGILRLHQPGVVSPAPRSSPRRVSAVRESRLAGQVTPGPRPDERSEAEPPDVPGFRTWRGVYLLVFGWFVLVVVLLTVFTRIFS